MGVGGRTVEVEGRELEGGARGREGLHQRSAPGRGMAVPLARRGAAWDGDAGEEHVVEKALLLDVDARAEVVELAWRPRAADNCGCRRRQGGCVAAQERGGEGVGDVA